jgi:hypothetical protein
LKEFLVIHRNPPRLTLTDNDQALTGAVKEVFNGPWVQCNWHLSRNISSRFGRYEKKANLKEVYRIILLWIKIKDPKKFDKVFETMIKGKLENDADENYMLNLFNRKIEWSRAYLRHLFNANTLTTSRSESMHSMIKRNLINYAELSTVMEILFEIDHQQASYTFEKELKVILFSS